MPRRGGRGAPLAEHAWDWKAALAALQRVILAHLGGSGGDRGAGRDRGTGIRTVGVARQYAGITGQVENCQTVVFLAYVTARAHILFDFRLYLPKAGARTGAAGERARVSGRRAVHRKPRAGHRDAHQRMAGLRGGAVRGWPS